METTSQHIYGLIVRQFILTDRFKWHNALEQAHRDLVAWDSE